MKEKSELSQKLYKEMLRRGYPEPFCDDDYGCEERMPKEKKMAFAPLYAHKNVIEYY